MKHKKEALFQPLEANGLKLNNRVVMAPLTRSRAYDNKPNEHMAEYYGQRSGAGLIISETISPSPNGLGYPRIPSLYNKADIPAWQKITYAVHAKDSKIFAQLNHPGRVGSSVNLPAGARIVAPSAINANVNVWTDVQGLVLSDLPEEMTQDDIRQTIREFARAAQNAMAAGFDGVELHGANGYLMEQFLNPHTNTRTDNYGGSIKNRCRFIIEVVDAVVDEIGADRVGIRFSPYNTMSSMHHYDTIFETYDYLATAMNDFRLLYIHLIDTVTRLEQDSNQFSEPLANCFTQVRNGFNGLIILNGGYTRERAIRDLATRKADLISFGIPFIANPDLPYRLEHNLELAKADKSTFYSPGLNGYTDYPAYQDGLPVENSH